MAMVDYPYLSGFLEPLPAWPVKVACSFISTAGDSFSGKVLATRLYYASNVYYNHTGSLKYNCIDPNVCGDPGTSKHDDAQLGRPWQECSEIVIDTCSRGGKNDFFWDECQTDSTASLIEQWNATFVSYHWKTDVWNTNAISLLYGLSLNSASNIILTQGELDPWSGGGYATNSAGVSQDRGICVMKMYQHII